jgi:hypothetical protein
VNGRLEAAEAVVRAMRTGERCFAAIAERHLADDATYVGAKGPFEGKAATLDRISGQWANTPVLAAGSWEIRSTNNGEVAAYAEFPGLGAAPKSLQLVFAFDSADRITRIVETIEAAPPPLAAASMSPAVRRRIDRALADGKPIVLSYVDDDGAPALSLRGSLVSYDDVTLCLWIRDAKSGLVRAIEAGRALSFLYRDSSTRTTLVGQGHGRIIDDPSLRRAIYDRTPEVEQRHDIALAGAAALIAIDSIRGTAPEGPILVNTRA